ncbi:hypothetical protein EV356DRAFT_504165 [Viridothelium virens]|uniref:L domain-like protein n=1 Tax=Viridothelium virens TaxID=1048519 RepID=A0A6A6HL38_VIRVR|nr:hypothetical protein EV356DRAFT_504165 [Viridothelium virens]
MASTAAWLEDLSEDWESQPRDSSLLDSTREKGSLRKHSIDSRASQSRIPRPLTGSKKDKTVPRKRSSILSERSMSENNILRDSLNGNDELKSATTRHSRAHSTSSVMSDAQFDTVDRKSLIRSPPKKSNAQLTPEWRRRLLNKDGGNSPEQADLFSPVGLERIFKNPKEQSSPLKQVGNRGISFLQGLETMPSSPPPLPSLLSYSDQSQSDNYNQLSELEPVQEADEDGLDCHTSQLLNSTADAVARQDEQSSEDTQQHNSLAQEEPCSHSERNAADERSIHQPESTIADNSDPSPPVRTRDIDRTISGQSELLHEGFSPVYLPKPCDSHGSIDSSLPDSDRQLPERQTSRDKSRGRQHGVKSHGDIVGGSSQLADSLPDDLETGTPEVAEIGNFVSLKRGGYSEASSFRMRNLSLSFNVDVSEMSGKFSPISMKFSSPPSDVLPPGSHHPAWFRKASSTRSSSRLKQSDTRKSTETLPSDPVETPIVIPKRRQSHQFETEDSDSSSIASGTRGDRAIDGKRPLRSPDKQRNPKRQKTMHGADFSELSKSTLAAVQAKHDKINSLIGKKRKDAKHDNSAPQADPLVMSRRQILRPRNPTPSQRRGTQARNDIEEADSFEVSVAPTLGVVQEQLESLVLGPGSSPLPSGPPLPEPVATMTMNAAKRMQEEGRKRSYTTQDYLDEAMQIMSKLRAGRKPESGLGSVQESASEHHSQVDPELATKLTNLSISRPPSRAGTPSGWRRPVKEEVDSEVAIHLRKYQEKENFDFTINSSLTSLLLATDNGGDQGNKDKMSTESMSRGRDKERNRGQDGSNQDGTRDGPGSYGSASTKTQSAPHSWDSSTGRTIATNSTRRSDTVANLAPTAVAHLIPEQVAGMSFDPEKHVWVRDKSLPRPVKSIGEISSAEESEQDPLGNIPDLSVDELKEMSRNVSETSGQADVLKRFSEDQSSLGPRDGLGTASRRSDRASPSQETVIARPRTREGSEGSGESSSIPSKDPQLTSSNAPAIETRSTSWRTSQAVQESKERISEALENPQPAVPSIDDDGEVEDEIEATHARTGGHARQHIKQVTISFSSPAIPRMSGWSGLYAQPEKVDEHLSTDRNQEEGTRPRQSNKQDIRESLFSAGRLASSAKLHRNRKDEVTAFSQIQEHEEWSLLPAVDNQRDLSLHVSMSSPQSRELIQPDNNTLISPSARHRADITFYLSDLPEFSFHQIDERRPSERILAERLATHELVQADKTFAETTKDLVRELMNVEPEEPYWDELQQLDLHDRHLIALHGLNEFCPQVKVLDVSANGLRDLDGTPASVRYLKAQNNTLSSLTAFTFLMNLQYLDISDNEIDRLEGLSCLVHLRELRADGNEVSDLDGLKDLDGLQKLHLRRNKVTTLDLSNSHLDHLSELNLSGNQISRVRGLGCLPKLDTLILDDNKLRIESFESGNTSTCPTLSTLYLRRNLMRQLSPTSFPNLRILLADGNQIPVDVDVSHLEKLETLSLRAQQLGDVPGGDKKSIGFRDTDLRQLALSSNRIPTFTFARSMYDLHRLELASCGMHTLPSNIGTLAPNLRFVNLSSNAIKDIRPLASIQRLRELHMTGNRLSRTRKVLVVLAKLKTLTRIDFRHNLFTVGFYPQERRVAKELVLRGADDSDDKDPHILPPQSSKEDREHWARLDEETYLRRRVYELLLASTCKELRTVDGLEFDRREILIKDAAWKLLIDGGILRRPES